MVKAALLFSIFGLLHPQVQTERLRAGHWRVDRSHDTFTGAVACRASLGALRVEGVALIVDFGPHQMINGAVYRLDAGPAISADTDAFNAQYHARLVGEAPIDNPSVGRIALPLASLGKARTLWIRTTPRAAPSKFDIDEVGAVRALEAKLGCP